VETTLPEVPKMPVVSQDFLEQTADLLAEAETERQSYADELAEKEQEIQSLRSQILQLMSDRSMSI
jgi:septal ring factor EnvC (AmiA/AmiB activator)